jgi:hypothetical protein
LDDLALTRTLERWARSRRQQQVTDRFAWAAAGLAPCTLAFAGIVALFPGTEALLLGIPVLVAVAGAWTWWGLRLGPTAESVARTVDTTAGLDGLLLTAMAVEGRRAAASPELGELVRAGAVDVLPDLEPTGAPPLEAPIRPLGIVLGCMLLGTLVAAALLVWPEPGDNPNPDSGPLGTAYHPPEAEDLRDAATLLHEVGEDPSLDAATRATANEARDALAQAANAPDPRAAAVALERARRALEKLEGSNLSSAGALRSARPEQVAQALDLAVQSGDTRAIRRLADEILRRTESSSEAELRALGRALSERLQAEGPGSSELRAAGQALEAQDGAAALAALADALGAVPPDTGRDPRQQKIRQASATVTKARERAMADQQGASRRPGAAEAAPTRPGEGNGPSPVAFQGENGGQGDGGGGGGQGGSEDLREGGTPGAAQDPQVQADAPGGSRADGPDGAGNRGVAGTGAARDGTTPEGPGGAGTGSGGTVSAGSTGGMAGQGPADAVAAGGPAVAGGARGGSGSGSESPLLELDPGVIASDWVSSQWSGAGGAMAGVVREAEAGGRSSIAWSQVHTNYAAIAEAAASRPDIPLSRRQYVQRYFQAIRPTTPATEDPR